MGRGKVGDAVPCLSRLYFSARVALRKVRIRHRAPMPLVLGASERFSQVL